MKKAVLPILILILSGPAHAVELDGYLNRAIEKHRGLEALREQRSAAEDAQVAGDSALIPRLTLSADHLSDKKQPNFFGGTETRSTEYDLNLDKTFSTGTVTSLFVKTGKYESLIPENSPLAEFSSQMNYSGGTAGIQITQSLWKNSFGRSTRLLDERLATTATHDVSQADLGARQTLIEIENRYWDYLLAIEERRIREASLNRALRLESWQKKRVADGIADQADMLTMQSLSASRRLQLLQTENDIETLAKQIHDDLEIPQNEPLPDISGSLSAKRELRRLIDGQGGNQGRVMKIDAWISTLDAKKNAILAQEADENVKSDLSLMGRYATNSDQPVTTGPLGGLNHLNRADIPTAEVKVTWTYMFDDEIKTSSKSAALKASKAASLMADRKTLESDTAWTDLQRQYSNLNRQIDAASTLQKIQEDRAKAEQNKLARGRAITLDVVNSEQDAADSALNTKRLEVAQRKLEASARLYISVKE